MNMLAAHSVLLKSQPQPTRVSVLSVAPLDEGRYEVEWVDEESDTLCVSVVEVVWSGRREFEAIGNAPYIVLEAVEAHVYRRAS